jgi:hypothetical protein
MAKFAVLNEDLIVDLIIAESKAVAEQVTGSTCVEFTDEPAGVGGTYSNGIFIQKKPYPSWVSDGASSWISPVEYPDEPDKDFIWDEETVSWVEILQ